MDKARPESEARGHLFPIADHDAYLLQRAAVMRIAFDIGEKGAMIPAFDRLKCVQDIHEVPAFPNAFLSSRRQRAQGRAPRRAWPPLVAYRCFPMRLRRFSSFPGSLIVLAVELLAEQRNAFAGDRAARSLSNASAKICTPSSTSFAVTASIEMPDVASVAMSCSGLLDIFLEGGPHSDHDRGRRPSLRAAWC